MASSVKSVRLAACLLLCTYVRAFSIFGTGIGHTMANAPKGTFKKRVCTKDAFNAACGPTAHNLTKVRTDFQFFMVMSTGCAGCYKYIATHDCKKVLDSGKGGAFHGLKTIMSVIPTSCNMVKGKCTGGAFTGSCGKLFVSQNGKVSHSPRDNKNLIQTMDQLATNNSICTQYLTAHHCERGFDPEDAKHFHPDNDYNNAIGIKVFAQALIRPNDLCGASTLAKSCGNNTAFLSDEFHNLGCTTKCGRYVVICGSQLLAIREFVLSGSAHNNTRTAFGHSVSTMLHRCYNVDYVDQPVHSAWVSR